MVLIQPMFAEQGAEFGRLFRVNSVAHRHAPTAALYGPFVVTPLADDHLLLTGGLPDGARPTANTALLEPGTDA